DKHGPLIDTKMVDGPSRGRAVGRQDSQRAGDEILPLASVTAPGGVNHPAPHGPVPFDSGHYDPHGPSLSPSAARLGNGMICHTYRRRAGAAAGCGSAGGRPGPMGRCGANAEEPMGADGAADGASAPE